MHAAHRCMHCSIYNLIHAWVYYHNTTQARLSAFVMPRGLFQSQALPCPTHVSMVADISSTANCNSWNLHTRAADCRESC